MYRVFILFLVASLGLPAVPVSGCDCNQKQEHQPGSCCCSTQDSKQTQNDKPCCCKNLQQQTSTNQPQCQKQGCDCRQVFSQPATATGIKSIKLTQQPGSQFETVKSISRLSKPTSSTQTQILHLAYSHSSSEFCAHFCLWQI